MLRRLLVIFVSIFLVLAAGPGSCSSAKPPVKGESTEGTETLPETDNSVDSNTGADTGVDNSSTPATSNRVLQKSVQLPKRANTGTGTNKSSGNHSTPITQGVSQKPAPLPQGANIGTGTNKSCGENKSTGNGSTPTTQGVSQKPAPQQKYLQAGLEQLQDAFSGVKASFANTATKFKNFFTWS